MRGEKKHQAVIVTGAASGIGKAITERCLSDGFTVLGCDINTAALQSLDSLASNDRLIVSSVDIANYGEVEAYFAKLKNLMLKPRYLVNNAGIYLGKNIFDYEPDEFVRVVKVNCLGAAYFSRFFAESLRVDKHHGVIVNMSSVAGQDGSSDAIYGLTKAGILGLTKSCAINFAPYVRVNAVAPALVTTSMLDNVPEWRQREYRQGELLQEPITPDDVADTVAFLLSDKSKHYTGAVFDINNGHYRR